MTGLRAPTGCLDPQNLRVMRMVWHARRPASRVAGNRADSEARMHHCLPGCHSGLQTGAVALPARRVRVAAPPFSTMTNWKMQSWTCQCCTSSLISLPFALTMWAIQLPLGRRLDTETPVFKDLVQTFGPDAV